MTATTSAPDLLTIPQAAELLNTTPTAVQYWMRQGKLPFYKFGPRNVRVARADVLVFIQQSRIAAPPMPAVRGRRNGEERRAEILSLLDKRAGRG